MALGTYIPTQWVNGTAPGINANKLNHIENGIKGVTDTTIVLESIVNQLIPVGLITMFSGAVIPLGWALCDGTNDTPDLVGSFILAGNGADSGQTGGSADAILVAHTHTASSGNAGGHTHTAKTGCSDGSYGSVRGSMQTVDTCSALRDNYIGEIGDHSHTVTVDSSGDSGTNANMPPYYKLAYIMKIA